MNAKQLGQRLQTLVKEQSSLEPDHVCHTCRFYRYDYNVSIANNRFLDGRCSAPLSERELTHTSHTCPHWKK